MKPKICVMMIFVLAGLALAAGCTTNRIPNPGDMIECTSLVTIVEKYEVPVKFPFQSTSMVQRNARTSDGRVFDVALVEPHGIPSQNRLWESLPVGVPGVVDTGMTVETLYGFHPINVTHPRLSCPNCCEVVP
jgi:hypothetical protein